ncbi:MgtC/SapB family protein [Salinarimonas sp. NSM]|uniref:MgtC/SapB family protein n=1 Tax=Salinarimonas sp. NSM TaxID=3458003 RepID=UPI0040356FAD
MVDEILYSGEIPFWDVTVRLFAAAIGGMLLGLDRELRGRATGLRTHGMVSLSSCVITISAFLVYEQALATGDQVTVDPLRAIQGLAQAIGFIAAGAIFVSKGDVRNLTSAANLWLAAAFGIALGAGQYTLAAVSVVFGIIMMSVVRVIELKLHLKHERDAD